jgi:uncharacterized protein (TIGR02145 family)
MVYAPYGNQQVGVNSAGQLPANTKEVLVKFTLEEGNDGPVIYEETHIDTTDQYGLLNTVIGTGTPTSNSPGLFNQIDWSLGDPHLRVSITLTQYNSTVSSYQKLWSVPYALYADQANSSNYSTNSGNADSSDYATQAGNGITGVTDNGDGTLTFTYLDGSSYTTAVLNGLTGSQGPAGVNGLSAYEIWLVQGNIGTEQDFLNSLQGATGAQGPQGIPGSPGQNGINGTNGQNGLSAYEFWLAQGNTGTQQDFLNSLTGPQGTNGQSAYELWLAQGNIGSEGDFLNSLQGATGPQGLQGPEGNGFQNGTVLGQVMYWDGSTWILLNPGSQAQILTVCNGVPTWTTGGVCPGNGTITSLNCASASSIGSLSSGILASGVISNVTYTGGNGGSHNGQTVTSTGVTGLTATLAPGNFATGSGSLSYSISGTPNTNGTAYFAINIGGQTCTLSLSVAFNLTSQYAAGSIFCASGPTAIVDVTNPTTGKTWMDRNLGASQVAGWSTNSPAYGDLYQWGRNSDGHQCRTSFITSTMSSNDQPTNGYFIDPANSPYDWRSPQNNNLWQGVTGINNPCPSGYRVPTEIEFEAERLSWGSNNTNGAFSSPLKLPVAGYRFYNGSLTNVGFECRYWSSTVNMTQARGLVCSGANQPAQMANSSRAYGYSVRCIKN